MIGCSMLIQSPSHRYLRPITVCLLLVLTISCGAREKYIGIYKAEANEIPTQNEIFLELKANGDGIWRVGDEEVPFSWYVRGGELRVNTKGGGVIVGSLEKDTIHLTLVGAKTMAFKRIQ